MFQLCDENPSEPWAAIGGRDPVTSVFNGDNRTIQNNGNQERAISVLADSQNSFM